MSPKDFYYHDAQRMKNCENALQHGCTFVRDSGGAYDMVSQLIEEIEGERLMGPKIMPSYEVLSLPGGMWDINKIVNNLAPMIFGGKVLNFLVEKDAISSHIKKMKSLGSKSIKVYLEEKPIYGGKRDTTYNMYTDEQVKYIRELVNEEDLLLESHAMFINGARKAIKER